MITDCLAVVGSILGEKPQMMAALSRNADAREFVVGTLTRNPEPRVRRQMGQLLLGARPMAGVLLRWLTGELEVMMPCWFCCRMENMAVCGLVLAECLCRDVCFTSKSSAVSRRKRNGE